jgi:hypothetical protein
MLEEGLMKFDDPNLEDTIHELVTLNESLLDSIKMAEMQLVGGKKPAPLPAQLEVGKKPAPLPAPPVPEPSHHKPHPVPKPSDPGPETGSLEIEVLVQTRDIFSLICMLRAQGDKRLESALALMR